MCWEGPKGPVGISSRFHWVKNDPKNGKSPKKWVSCLFMYKTNCEYEAGPAYVCATGYKKDDSVWVHDRDLPDPVPDENIICWIYLPTKDEIDHLNIIFAN